MALYVIRESFILQDWRRKVNPSTQHITQTRLKLVTKTENVITQRDQTSFLTELQSTKHNELRHNIFLALWHPHFHSGEVFALLSP